MLTLNNFFLLCYLASFAAFFVCNKVREYIGLLAGIQLGYVFGSILAGSPAPVFCGLLLLNGPLLMLISTGNQKSYNALTTKILHAVPFGIVFFTSCFFTFFTGKSNTYLQTAESCCTAVSIAQLIYCCWISGSLQGQYQISSSITRLIRQLCVLFILNGLFIFLTELSRSGGDSSFGFNGYLLSYLICLLAVLLMARDLIFEGGDQISLKITQPTKQDCTAALTYRYSALESAYSREIEAKITACLKDQQVFLQSDITLENLSSQIQVPKQHVSQVLNVHMGKNFYNLIAQYRIEHALQSMQVNQHLKIEAFAYSCGFNSVSAFNRYFKVIVGIPPSVYLKKLEK